MLKYAGNSFSKSVQKNIRKAKLYMPKKNASIIGKGLFISGNFPKKGSLLQHAIQLLTLTIRGCMLFFGETELQNICILLIKRRKLIWKIKDRNP